MECSKEFFPWQNIDFLVQSIILECANCGNNNFKRQVMSCFHHTPGNCPFQQDFPKSVDEKINFKKC